MGIDNFITFDAHDPRVANAIPLKGFDNYVTPFQFVRALLDVEKDLIIEYRNHPDMQKAIQRLLEMEEKECQ